MECVKIKPSDNLIKILKNLDKLCTDIPSNVKKLLENETNIYLLNSDIKWTHSKIKEHKLPFRIYELLEESKTILPERDPSPPRSPELEERIKRLQWKANEQQYQSMVKNLTWQDFHNPTGIPEMRKEFQEMNRHLVTGAQYLLSIIGTFCGVFFGISYVLPDYGARVLLAIISALAVAVAEIYFIIRDDIRLENYNDNPVPFDVKSKKVKPIIDLIDTQAIHQLDKKDK